VIAGGSSDTDSFMEELKELAKGDDRIFSTANTLQLSKASVTSYLPYEKGVYFPSTADKEKISVGAERQRRYRAVRKLRTEPTEGLLRLLPETDEISCSQEAWPLV
ncbi:MAG: hypothetical protein ACLT3J_15305, partial [Ruminococcus sp.]